MFTVPEMKVTVVYEKKHGGQYPWRAKNKCEEYWIGPRFYGSFCIVDKEAMIWLWLLYEK